MDNRLSGRFTISSEGTPMLREYCDREFTADERRLFDQFVPFDHWTRQADLHIDFAALRKSIEPRFSDKGRPAVEPVRCLKLELIMFHDGLSDRQVLQRVKTDLAYRRFLRLGPDEFPPDERTLRGFRSRLGVEGHQQVFHALLSQARAQGLVKDRLRLASNAT